MLRYQTEIEIKARTLKTHNAEFSSTLAHCVLTLNKQALAILAKDTVSISVKKTLLKCIQIVDAYKGGHELRTVALVNLGCFYCKSGDLVKS